MQKEQWQSNYSWRWGWSVPPPPMVRREHSRWYRYRRWQSYAGFRLACRSPLCRYAAWSSLAVSELQLSAAMPLWLYHRAASLPSWIEFNCRSGQSGKVIDLLARCCLPLGHPSAASGTCAVVQISSSKRHCGERQASLKAALPSLFWVTQVK